jgi:hypothetical membrane protein
MALVVSHPDRTIPLWALLTAALAPISLVGCWLAAGFLQPARYDPVRQSISALAGAGASDRWIMTVGLYSVAICQILTGVGLCTARPGARTLLVAGGLAGLGVAVFPQTPHGPTTVHLTFTTVAVILLALWPATIVSRQPAHPLLGVRRCATVTALFIALLLWLLAAAQGAGALGIAERIDTAIESAWPLVIIIAIRQGSPRLSPGKQYPPRLGSHLGPSRPFSSQP